MTVVASFRMNLQHESHQDASSFKWTTQKHPLFPFFYVVTYEKRAKNDSYVTFRGQEGRTDKCMIYKGYLSVLLLLRPIIDIM